MKTAFLFPGQGSQFVGMGSDLAESFAEARAVLDRADEILGFGLSDLMFGSKTGHTDADADALKRTEVTQPALFVHSQAAIELLRLSGLKPDSVAGHSLGEYSALTAAGALTFEDGLRTVRLRGQLMAGAGDVRPGAMAAVLGVDDNVVEQVCAEATTESEVVQPANYNSPGQIVISGDDAAVERAMAIAGERGARRVMKLPVSGAFHSPLMGDAKAGLAEALESLTITTPECPIYLNVTADPTTDPDAIRGALLDQLTSPVRWSQTLKNMSRDGFESFVEVGAGRVLSGLVKRTLGRETATRTAGTADEF